MSIFVLAILTGHCGFKLSLFSFGYFDYRSCSSVYKIFLFGLYYPPVGYSWEVLPENISTALLNKFFLVYIRKKHEDERFLKGYGVKSQNLTLILKLKS